MRLSSLRYLIKQGWKNMAANRLMTFASIGVLTACLIITGIATLVFVNVNNLVDYLANQNEIVVYLLPETPEEQAVAMNEQIASMQNVLEVEYNSKTDAFEEVEQWLDTYGNLLQNYEQIFPARFLVTVEDLNFIEQTNAELAALPGVDFTQVPSDLAGIIITIKNAVTYGGLGLVAILAVVSVIVISNTIRLTVFARRREISIMKYVGATNAFIRLPFFVEGMTVGLIAGILASAVVCTGYYFVYQYLMEMYNTWVMSLMNNIFTLENIWYYVAGGFAVFGILIGGFGTATSVRKHLKV
ncbi:permease-like cell division protein FtsX [Ruminococcaceae bacterium OttesenSCG-928-I18]|nr:permease-like cell division protein FtsX [Ruminococcaceae bacterium OttesenSCG-928-I18]